jgi:hypothetical protein
MARKAVIGSALTSTTCAISSQYLNLVETGRSKMAIGSVFSIWAESECVSSLRLAAIVAPCSSLGWHP